MKKISPPSLGFLDDRYVNVTGDTMTGALSIDTSNANITGFEVGDVNDTGNGAYFLKSPLVGNGIAAYTFYLLSGTGFPEIYMEAVTGATFNIILEGDEQVGNRPWIIETTDEAIRMQPGNDIFQVEGKFQIGQPFGTEIGGGAGFVEWYHDGTDGFITSSEGKIFIPQLDTGGQSLKALGDSTTELDVRRTISGLDNTNVTGAGTIQMGGDFSSATDLTYKVEITTGGEIGVAIFRWSDDGGSTWDQSSVTTGVSPVNMNNGLKVWFVSGNGTDFNANDYATVTAIGTDNQNKTLQVDTTNNKSTFDGEVILSDMALGSPTYTSLHDFVNNTMASGYNSGGTTTDNGDGSAAVAAGTGYIRADATSISALKSFDFSADNSVNLTDNQLNYVYVDYNSGTPIVDATIDVTSLDHTSQFVMSLVYRKGTDLHITNAGQKLNNFIHKMYYYLWEHGGIQRAWGAVTSEDSGTGLALNVTQGRFYWALEQITTSAIDTANGDTFNYYYRASGSGWTLDDNSGAGFTTINNTQYDDGDGTLGTLTANRYGVHWLYMVTDGDIYVVFGQGDYVLAQAEATTAPTSLPGELANTGVLIAKIIVQKSASNIAEITIPWVSEVGFSAATDHGGLAGLSDDDHTQYVLDAGDTMTGELLGFGLLQKQSVANGETLTITSGYSMVVADNFEVEGTLEVEGTFLIA